MCFFFREMGKCLWLMLIASMFLRCASVPICKINSFDDYNDDLKKCTPAMGIIFNVSNISAIPQKIITQTPMVYEIFISKISLKSIGKLGMCQWRDLHLFNASMNEITSIGKNTFKDCKRLGIIDLSMNNIAIIDENGFTGLGELYDLDMSRNKISQITRGLFKSLIKIENLRLSNNRISTINEDTFNFNANLQLIDLNFNSLQNLNFDFTNFTTKLEQINLIGNPIQSVNIDSMMHLKKLEKITVSTNFLNTDMLSKLKNEKKRWKIMVIDPSREDEIAIVPQKAFANITIPTTPASTLTTDRNNEIPIHIRTLDMEDSNSCDLLKIISIAILIIVLIVVVIQICLFVYIKNRFSRLNSTNSVELQAVHNLNI